MHTAASNWAVIHLGRNCLLCNAPDATLHHIVARRLFRDTRMPHFRQNLIMLCLRHHSEADTKARLAMKEQRPASIPFAENLPSAILDQLARDGLVSTVTPECDYSPIGLEGDADILRRWRGEIHESPDDNALDG